MTRLRDIKPRLIEPRINDSDDNQLSPHSEEAEEALLGSILINPDVLYNLKKWVEPRYFFIVKHAWVFEAMLSVEARREEIDTLTVGDELRVRRQLDEVGGAAFLLKLSNDTPTHINFATYARTVKECWRRREFLALAAQLAMTAIGVAPDGSDSAAARRILEEARELMNDPYDPLQDGLRQHLIHARDLGTLPPIKWIIPGEIPDQGLTIVYGPSGVGKSFFVLDYALRIAQYLKVLYIAAEGEGGFRTRVQAWQTHYKQDVGELHFYMNVAALLDDKERAAFMGQILDFVKPQVLIVDTVAHCMLPGNENDTRDMGLFIRAAKGIQKAYQTAVILVHHTNKEGQQERGSGALRAAADSMIKLTGDDDVIAVESAKSKDSEAFKTRYIKLLPVDLGEGQYTPVVIAAEKVERTQDDPITNRQADILRALDDIFDGQANSSDLVEVTKIPKGSLLRSMAQLKKLHYVIQPDRLSPYDITPEGKAAIGRYSREAQEDKPDSVIGNMDKSDYVTDNMNRVTQGDSWGDSLHESQRADHDSVTHSNHSKNGSATRESPESPESVSHLSHQKRGDPCPVCGNTFYLRARSGRLICAKCLNEPLTDGGE